MFYSHCKRRKLTRIEVRLGCFVPGVILYALLCGTLPFDDEHVPTLFRKIKSGIFAIPEYLNKNVISLLCQMLQVDPLKRATIEEIKKHDWFQRDLPNYLFPSTIENDSNIIDTLAVAEVCLKFGVSEMEVHNALLSGDRHDQLAIAYHLIIDNKRFANDAEKSEMENFYVVPPSSPPPTTYTSPNEKSSGEGNSPASFRHPERIAPLRERAAAMQSNAHAAGGGAGGGGVGGSGGSAAGANLPITGTIGNEKRGTPVKRAKWHLGIRSQSKPNDIMLEVYRAMKALDYEWKIINPYHVRVRRANKSTGKHDIKMSLQLYQVDAKSYLLDFKSLTNEEVEQGDDVIMDAATPPNSMGIPAAYQQPTGHHTMEFFEMCAALIIQLAR